MVSSVPPDLVDQIISGANYYLNSALDKDVLLDRAVYFWNEAEDRLYQVRPVPSDIRTFLQEVIGAVTTELISKGPKVITLTIVTEYLLSYLITSHALDQLEAYKMAIELLVAIAYLRVSRSRE